jgi:NAD-dependent deacetylase
MSDPDLVEVSRRIRTARSITVLTGAGVSAASGVPTFRGADGLWRRVRAETLATPEAFANDPKLVWEWYDWRRQMIAAVRPNRAHDVLAAWTRLPGVRMTLITQNVDGLHERAGADPILRLHGSIWRLRCWQACDAGRAGWHDDTAPLPTLPPRCPHCHGLARPDVVWFGEPLDPQVLDAAAAACACDLFLIAGTSAVVYPAAGLLPIAAAHGAFTVEINTDRTEASARVHVSLKGRAEDILETLHSAALLDGARGL